ncbi:MAG: hypothetical protein Q8O57_13340, partial [Kiritimatiellota bacterium]|nr:hypothetical protein [Kiritimatiellota bacterium]
MIFELSRLFLKDTKKRLRPSDQAQDKGLRAFFNKPAMGLVYWLLVWLAAFLLQMVPTLPGVGNGAGGPARLVPGRASPVTVVSAGTVLVERGQKVDAAMIEKIRGYQAQVKDGEPFSNRLQKLAGDGLLLFLGLMVTAIMFR